MNQYEITYLIDPQVNEEAREELNVAIDSKISELKGKVDNSKPTLRRKLAYPIDKKQSVFMRNMHIELDPAALADLREHLKKTNSILRVTILNTPLREGLSPETLKQRDEEAKQRKEAARKEQREVTMEDVEKGIEDALTEEVK